MILRKYGVAATVLFPLIARGLSDLKAGATFAAGDVKIIKDEGASANTTNLPTDEGNGWYSLVLTATEMQLARGALTVVDQSAPKIWEDQAFAVETYGNASAQHALDLGTIIENQVWDAGAAGHQDPNSIGHRIWQGIRAASAQAATATTITLDAAANSVDDFYKGALIVTKQSGATGSGQARLITAYNGTTKVATITPAWVTTPASTIGFVLFGVPDADAIADALLKRPLSSVEPTATFRTPYGAFAALVNRRRINAGNLEVFKTDDATVLGTLAVTTDAAQDPVKELDTV